jgi:hypothetical protein
LIVLRRVFIAATIVVAAAVTGCNGGSTNPPAFPTGTLVTPSPTPIPVHLYVANDSASGAVVQYSLPITGASTQNFSIATEASLVTVAVDATGNMAVGNINANLQFFNAPLSAASAPAATFANGGGSNTGQITFSAAGDMFVGTTGNSVKVFTHPFSNASTPSLSITNAAFVSTIGTALDAAANLYVSNPGTGTALTCSSGAGSCSDLLVFAPPYTGAPIVTPNVASTAYRKIAVSATQLIASQVAGATGRVDVYSADHCGERAGLRHYERRKHARGRGARRGRQLVCREPFQRDRYDLRSAVLSG